MAAAMEQSVETMDSIVPAEEEHEYLTGSKLLATMSSLTLVGFLMMLDVSVVATAIPRITTDFHSLDDVGWYGTSYMLATSALQPLTGKIYSNFSPKWVFLSFFAVFELGSVLCGSATSSNMLIVSRSIAGLGASGLLNGGYSIIHASVPLPRQPLHLGILTGVSQLGILSGPLIGGALTQYATWRWCFYINLPCGGVAAILLFASLPHRNIKGARKQTILDTLSKLDLIGFSLFAPAAIQFIFALEFGGIKYSWNSATVIGLFCGSFGTLLVFLAWEYHMGDQAMIPLSIIGRRAVWSSSLNYACFMGSMLISSYYLPIYFQAVRNATPTLSGVNLLPSIISIMLFGIVSGGLVGRIGYYLPFAVASGVLTTIGSGLVTTFTPTTAVGVWIGYQILMGAGRGIGIQIPIIAVQNNSSKKEISIVNALVVCSQNLGSAVFLSLAEVIFSNGLRHGLATFAPEFNPDAVIAAGATAVRSAVPAASLPGVILAYSKAFDRVMYLATGAAGGAFLFAFGMRWMSIKKVQTVKPASEQEV
ncbi:major facilitator superfamily domain-containing protein [Lipomyces tetrasporus]